MCRVLEVHPSGFYQWLIKPKSDRAVRDAEILERIVFHFERNHRWCGSPRIFHDLREEGLRIGRKRVERLMRLAGLKAERGYKRPKYRYGKPAVVVPNLIEQDFSASAPNEKWVTDFSYIRTWEGWLFLTVVMDLCSRKVVGWAMSSEMRSDMVIDALSCALSKRKPTGKLIIHSDQVNSPQ